MVKTRKVFRSIVNPNNFSKCYFSRDEAWAKEKGMDCFLSVGKGSDKKAMFVELHYNHCQNDEKNVVLVGKGEFYFLFYLINGSFIYYFWIKFRDSLKIVRFCVRLSIHVRSCVRFCVTDSHTLSLITVNQVLEQLY